MRLAVFDVNLRRKTGQWQLDRRIELDAAVRQFADHDTFLDDRGRIRLPLHEVDTPALTDEYLLIDSDRDSPTVTFYDIGSRKQLTTPLAEIESAFPAWRARFWTPAFRIESAPFLEEFGTSEAEPVTLDPVEPTSEETSPHAIIDAARSELAARRTAERERRRTAFERLPVSEFIDSYGGLTGATPAGRETDDFGQQTVIVELPADHELAGAGDLAVASGIHPGDVVVLDADGTPGFPIEAEVFNTNEKRIELGVYWDTADESGAESVLDGNDDPNLSIGILVDGSRYSAIEAAIGTVERTDHALARFAGHASLTFDRSTDDIKPDVALNRDQRTALERVIAADALAMIRTPPGTGARRLLWSVLRESVEAGERVCVLAPDATAIDRLLTEAGTPSIVDRASNAGYTLHRCRPDEPPPIGAEIVAAPLTHANLVDDHEYDLAALDQAARVSVPAGAIPFAKASRVVLLGDPMQSPPSPLDRTIGDAIAPSIYAHVAKSYGEDVRSDLRCQYRMNQAIALFPNRTFYDDQLIHGQGNREQQIAPLDPLVAFQINGDGRETPTGSVYSDERVATAIDEVDRLVEHGVAPEDIGILTPSSAETGKLRAALQTHDETIAAAVTVGGLDRFRCDGREAMIVSFVRGGNEVDPFWMPAGITVAVTRAGKRLALLGDWQAIETEMADEPAGKLASYLSERGLIDMSS